MNHRLASEPAPPAPAGPADAVGRGIALRIASAAFFALMAALLKLASQHGVVAAEMLFYRAAFGLPVVLTWALVTGGPRCLLTRRPLAHVGRVLLGAASILCMFQAIILLPLADATAIGFTAPVFATLLSWLLLRERVGGHRWAAVACGLVGILIVVRPGEHHAISPIGVAIGVAGALGTAGVAITLRTLRKTEHTGATVVWFFVGSLLIGLALLPFQGNLHGPWTLLLLAGGGVAGGLMQIAATASLRIAPVSVLAPFDYFQIVVAVLLGWLFFATIPTGHTIAGAALIASGGLYTAYRERRLGRGSDTTAPID